MKRTHKKVLGFFGLLLVAAMTVFAVFLPAPDTQAADVNSVTDTIKVRVVSQSAAINISGIAPGSNITSSSQNLEISYENIETLTSTITFTGVDGVTHDEMPFLNLPVDYVTGVSNIKINFKTGAYTYDYDYYDETDDTVKTSVGNVGQLDYYGYGEYVIKAFGSSIDGVYYETLTDFTYQPVDATVKVEDGKATIDLGYDPYDETGETDGDVAKIVIEIRDENGNIVGTIKPNPITVFPPDTQVTVDLAGSGLPSGTYTVDVTAYDIDGNVIYKTFTTHFVYEAPVIPVPDTGGIMGNLNISKTDYLITGLIIFGVAAAAGVAFIVRNDKRRNTRRRR